MQRLNEDAYPLWLENAVTSQFIEWARDELAQLKKQDRVASGSIERIAIDAIATQSRIDCLEQVLSWRPKHD